MLTGVEQVRAGLAALASADVVGLPDAQVRAEILELVAARNQLDAALADRVATFDVRDLADVDGQHRTWTWLWNFARLSKGAALALVSRARLMRRLQALAQGMRDGTVSVEQFAKVVDLAKQIGVEKVAGYDQVLAALCEQADPATVAHACARILALEDPDGAEPDPDADFAKREIVFSRLGAMLHIRGRLDPQGAAALQSAVDAIMRPPAPGDERSAAQRRADALVDLARLCLTSDALPTVGGERPHVGLLITPDLLFGTPDGAGPGDGAAVGAEGPQQPAADVSQRTNADTGGSAAVLGDDPLTAAGVPPAPQRPWLNWVGDVHTDVARRIACDATVWRLIVDPRTGMPLDVGEKYRLVPWWIRKALWARDRRCRFPGCDTPAEWTDAHHLTPWWRQKLTGITGCVSLCRYHHQLVHEGGWSITLDHASGAVHARRPDGRPYELGPSMPWTSPNQQAPTPRTADPPRPAAA